MSRREDEEQQVSSKPVMRKVSISGIGQQIKAPTGLSGIITDAYVKYPVGAAAKRVTEVPSGKEFEIWAEAENLNSPEYTWEILFTAVGGGIAQYKSLDIYGKVNEHTGPQELERDSQGRSRNPIMPDKELGLRISLWGNLLRGQDLPPVAEW